MKHKLFTLFLVLAASIGITNAAIVNGSCGENLSWSLDTDEGTLVITGYGEMTDWHSSNDVPWQPYLRYIKNVSFPEGLTSIGGMAFLECSRLTEVIIPTNVSSIANGAFRSCLSLTAINVVEENQNYSSVDGVLYNKAQTILYIYPAGKQDNSFDVPENIVEFDSHAFENSYINSVSLPASLTNIGEYIFEECSNLTSINVAEGNSIYSSEDGILFNKNKTVLYKCPERKSGTYNIPDNVTEIAQRAFYLSNMTSISMSNSVTLIGEQSFAFCYYLTDITLSNNLVEIKPWAFYHCSDLTTITIPSSVTIIGERAFYSAGLISVTIPENVTSLGDNVFHGCNSLINIEVISANPNYSSLNGVLYNKDQTILLQYPKGKTNTSFEIPESVTSIGKYAFYFASLSSIIIPSSVTTIELGAFDICRDLSSIICHATTPPSLNGTIFSQVSKSACVLYVPTESISLYQNTDQWKDFTNILPIPGTEPEETDITVIYKDRDEVELDNEQITLHLPEAPIVPGFTFVGWDVVAGHLDDGITIQAVYTYNGDPTSAPAEVVNPANKAQKLIREGNVYILHEGKSYSVQGLEVK